MTLTEQQQAFVDRDGDVLLLACPGSGKTRAAAARAGRLAAQRSRVAVCSYTNVGAQRFESVLCDRGVLLGPAHFVGTLHRFLLRYVVYPFGHLVMGAGVRPRLREGGSWPTIAVGGDHTKRFSIRDVRYDAQGAYVVKRKEHYIQQSHEELLDLIQTQLRTHKRALARRGIVSADDAIWLALCLLRRCPEIARAVAGRFDEMLVDEAQDTSELQLACLHEIKASGRLGSLVLIGDLEQSIFSFQGASADGCQTLADQHALGTVTLTENHRCSQRICDVAHHFSSRSEPDLAVGPDAKCPIVPEVVLYDPADPTVAIARFRERLDEHGVAHDDAAVLTRWNALVRQLNGETEAVPILPRPLQLGRACAALRQGTLTRRRIADVQRVVAYCAWGAEALDALDDTGAERVRLAAVALLDDLPDLDTDLRSWIQGAAAALGRAVAPLVVDLEDGKPRHSPGRTLQSKPAQASHSALETFTPAPRTLSAQTVHDIKGEDREAVLIVIDRPRRLTGVPQIALWEQTFKQQPIRQEDEEERRVAFVALTRARKFCLVALPDDRAGRAAADAFVNAGFASLG